MRIETEYNCANMPNPKVTLGAILFCLTGWLNLSGQGRLDLTDPKVRSMILQERKNIDCKGIYQQTRLKVDAQVKLLSKVEASGGVTPQTVANLTETTTALGQKRKEFCELYKADPTFTKDDYLRVYGELGQKESDVALILGRISGKHETADNAAVNASLTEIRQSLNQMDVRVGAAEKRITGLQAEAAAKEEQRLRAEVQRLEAQLDDREKRKENRLKVGRFLNEGSLIKAECDSLEERPYLQAKAIKWANETIKGLESIDASYAPRFQDRTGPMYGNIGGKALPQINEQVWNWVNLRTEALNRILETMPN